jgi:protein-tyrosine phosphatase
MAEFIFKFLVKERGLDNEFVIMSSATSTEEIWNGIGNPIYPPAAEELKRRGIPFEKRRAVQLKREDLAYYDVFVGMDSANIRNMRRILGEGSEGKIVKLMDLTPRGGDVADPWYSDRFDIAYRDIYEGCLALLDKALDEA